MSDFEALYTRHFQAVYRFLLSLCRDGALAEELTQETFYRAMKGLKGYRGDCSAYSWLCQIAKNAYFNHSRRRSPQPLDEGMACGGAQDDPLGGLLEGERTASLHRAIHRLAEPYKEVFTLRVFALLSYRDIAELFGQSENWARVVFCRAKARLAERIKEDDPL